MKRTKIVLIMILTIMEVCSIFLTWKSLSHKVTIIDDVKFKEENIKEKKTVAIMLNEGDGSYKESTSTTFPKVGYIYNSEKSGCIDTTGKEVVNAINYESGKVSLRLNQKLYCYLYFDKKDAPIIDKFYINDETSNKTTKVPEVTIHLKWGDQYIKEYCISETQDIDSCTWQSTNGVTEINNNFTLSNNRGNKILYAYIKDIAEGISEAKSDCIEYNPPITGDSLADKPISGVLEPTGVAQDELVTRYYGTNPPNYICFGTNDKDICIDDIDKYMYRIIGVDKKGRFKLIKKTPIEQNSNKVFYWHNVYNQDIKWNASDLFKGLNGISGGKYSDLFIGNTTYVPSRWEEKIETVDWKYGDFTNANKTATQMVQQEQLWSTRVSAKIGLMYVTDYYYGLSKTGTNCSNSGQYSTCKTSWMHFSNNDISALNTSYEWTMSRYGYISSEELYYSAYDAWRVASDGRVMLYTMGTLSNKHSVRPVFYLVPTIEISGSGTQTDPYIIVN